MLTRSTFCATLASAVVCLSPPITLAQPKTPFKSAGNNGPSAQVIPVSFTNEQVAATVNGEKILVGDVKKILDQRPLAVALTEEQKKQLRQAAVEVLIEDILMRQYLAKHVPQVNPADISREMQDLSEALTKKNQTLAEFLKESGQTEDELRREISARLQWRALLLRMLPDEKAKTYFDENKQHFDNIYVRASHILIKLPANHSKDQRDKALQQMLVYRQEIMTGKVKFEEAAKLYSHCPSKDKGGDIGPFRYKFVVVPQFAQTAFSMKVGQISEPIQSVFGIHLILVTERTPGEATTFEPMKQTVREVWAQDEDLYDRILTAQRKSGQIKIDLP